jgi:hypothetical protein
VNFEQAGDFGGRLAPGRYGFDDLLLLLRRDFRLSSEDASLSDRRAWRRRSISASRHDRRRPEDHHDRAAVAIGPFQENADRHLWDTGRLIGPEYDTVGYDLVKRAAREAVDLYDTLIVCGFAFAPEVDETRLNFSSLTVLKARMNQDLRMGDKLKATGAGNLFVVFGEPDLRVTQSGDSLIQVEIKGMDIFDFRLAPGVCALEADKPSARPSVGLCRCRAP